MILPQLFVEVFKDREFIVESLVENLKKVEEVEHEMREELKRTFSEIDNESESASEKHEDLYAKIDGRLTKFENQDLMHVTKYFKVTARNGRTATLSCSSSTDSEKAWGI